MRNFKSTKFFFSVLVVSLVVSISVGVVLAEEYYYSVMWWTTKFSNQYNIRSLYTKEGTINHAIPIQQGEGAWNSSAAPVLLVYCSHDNDIDIYFKSKDYGNTGWHASMWPPILFQDASCKINDYYYNDYQNNHSELVSHELGHALRLNDIDSSYQTLMRSSGYNGSSSPTPSDVAGVQEAYN